MVYELIRLLMTSGLNRVVVTRFIRCCYRNRRRLTFHFHHKLRLIVLVLMRVEICAQENRGRAVDCRFAQIGGGNGLSYWMYALSDLNHLFSGLLYRERRRLSVKIELW